MKAFESFWTFAAIVTLACLLPSAYGCSQPNYYSYQQGPAPAGEAGAAPAASPSPSPSSGSYY